MPKTRELVKQIKRSKACALLLATSHAHRCSWRGNG
jgi:hypothetical protein